MIRIAITLLFFPMFGFCGDIQNSILLQNQKTENIHNKKSLRKKTKKSILKEKYQQLEEQHIVVMVLAKQYNKELQQLRSLESLFCNYFDLDVKKWRQNFYVWDDLSETFLERNLKKNDSNKK